MAVTIGNVSDNTSQGTNSYSHNNNGDAILLFAQGTTAPTGATYNGVALTQVGTNQAHTAFGRTLNLWELHGGSLASGSNTIAVSGGANVTFGVVSFSGTNATTPFSGFVKSSVTSSTPSQAVTTTINNAYVFAHAIIQNFSSIGANTTVVSSLNGDANDKVIRSTNVVGTAGSFTLNINSTGGETAFTAVGVNPVAGVDYPITAAQGSFSLTGQVVNFRKALKLALAVGTYSLTGIEATFKLGKGIVASTGSFILTGIDVALRFGGWSPISKNSSNYTNVNKNNSIWTNED